MNCVSSPGVSRPLTISVPPNHRMLAVAAPNMIWMNDELNTCLRFALRCDSARSVITTSNFCFSNSCAPKARTTRAPARFSCITVVILPVTRRMYDHTSRREKLTTADRYATMGTNISPTSASRQFRKKSSPAAPNTRMKMLSARSSPPCTKFRIASTSAVARDIWSPVCCPSW